MLGVPREEVDRCVEAVDLCSGPRPVVGRLSGGQRSRVSLAVALLGSPELLVLDEPTVGLDPVLRRDLWAMFHALADEGTAVLVSSHVMDEAERCDRLLLMRDGALLAADTPQALLERTGAADVEARSSRWSTERGRRHERRGSRSRWRPGCCSSCAATTAPWRCCCVLPCLVLALLWWMFERRRRRPGSTRSARRCWR